MNINKQKHYIKELEILKVFTISLQLKEDSTGGKVGEETFKSGRGNNFRLKPLRLKYL